MPLKSTILNMKTIQLKDADWSEACKAMPVVTRTISGILSSDIYKRIPQILKFGKSYNAILLCSNLGAYQRFAIKIFGVLPIIDSSFEFLINVTTTAPVSAGNVRVYKQNGLPLVRNELKFYVRTNDEKLSLWAVSSRETSSDINETFIFSRYESVVQKVIIDETFQEIAIIE